MLQPGNEQWSADIKLATVPLHRLRGRLLDPVGDPVGKASITMGRGFGPTLTEETKDDGSFEFAAADGQWSLSASVDRSGVKLRCTRTVDLNEHDREDLEMRL